MHESGNPRSRDLERERESPWYAHSGPVSHTRSIERWAFPKVTPKGQHTARPAEGDDEPFGPEGEWEGSALGGGRASTRASATPRVLPPGEGTP